MEELGTMLTQYYDYIGIIPNETRQEDQVFARSAMMVVLRERMTLHQLGRLFNKNHATIHHAVKNHEINHNWSPMYRAFYAAAKEVVKENPVSGWQLENRTQAELVHYKMKVIELKGEVEKLNKELLIIKDKNTILQKTLKECKLSLAQ